MCKRFFFQIIGLIIFSCSLTSAYAGFTINATRVVYSDRNREASLSISSQKNDKPLLIQSWVDPYDNKPFGKQDIPFVVTPPLFVLNANQESLIRIVYIGNNLPQDRESVFWLNIKTIPSTDSESTKNKLLIAIKSRLKLFYRPAGLSDDDAASAYTKLNFSQKNHDLIIKNPTPFYINLHELLVNGQEVKHVHMIPPMQTVTYPVPAEKTVRHLKWQAVNDYGGLSEEATYDIK